MNTNIKYILSLTPDQGFKAVLMIAIIFLVGRDLKREYDLKEKNNEIKQIQIEHLKETNLLWDRVIEGQNRRQDILDSTIKQVKEILQTKMEQK